MPQYEPSRSLSLSRTSTLRPLVCLLSLVVSTHALGCGPSYKRDAEHPELNDPAMSTGLDKKDLDKLLNENLKSFTASPISNQWRTDATRPTVAIYPLTNGTTEHIDSPLNALLSDIETYMVNSNLITVVSVERQQQMIAEIEKQHGGGFDVNHIAEYNRQLGAKFYFTGKVYASDERSDDGRRVQYFMFMQLIEVSTSRIVWQNKSAVTKALM